MKTPSPTRFLALVLVLGALGVAWAGGWKTLAWVRYDPATKTYVLSNGGTLPGTGISSLKAGRWVEVRGETIIPQAQWRPPQDIEKHWTPKGATRVTFSHERHFASLGGKNCLICHADEKGLGSGKDFESRAPDVTLEPHAAKSLGRFCSNCHNDQTKPASFEGVTPSVNPTVFPAFGHTGDGACSRCHVPVSHGADFVPNHPLIVAAGTGRCSSCHRGAQEIRAADLSQALGYVHAQQTLLENPEDTVAFQKTLPNHFCTYCHTTQENFWTIK
jgi:hypothetical protein